jgi:hypothetical protein
VRLICRLRVLSTTVALDETTAWTERALSFLEAAIGSVGGLSIPYDNSFAFLGGEVPFGDHSICFEFRQLGQLIGD